MYLFRRHCTSTKTYSLLFKDIQIRLHALFNSIVENSLVFPRAFSLFFFTSDPWLCILCTLHTYIRNRNAFWQHNNSPIISSFDLNDSISVAVDVYWSRHCANLELEIQGKFIFHGNLCYLGWRSAPVYSTRFNSFRLFFSLPPLSLSQFQVPTSVHIYSVAIEQVIVVGSCFKLNFQAIVLVIYFFLANIKK